jgi:UDP-glucose 4-epimerase
LIDSRIKELAKEMHLVTARNATSLVAALDNRAHLFTPLTTAEPERTFELAGRSKLVSALSNDKNGAPIMHIGESVEDPQLYYQNNVVASAALLQTLLSFQTIPVVFSSTCATYGAPETIPISEDHPQRPVTPYGYSKLVVERMLADLDWARGLRSISLRYFNAAGADPDGEIGEAHEPETHLIPLVLAAARDSTPVSVFGDDYDTTDGTCVRDYVHGSISRKPTSWRWNTCCVEERLAA